MLKEFYDPRNDILKFLGIQIVEVSGHISDVRVHDIAFLLDLTPYLSQLKVKLQPEHQLVFQMCSHVKTFQAQPRLLKIQPRHCNTLNLDIAKSSHDHRLLRSANFACILLLE